MSIGLFGALKELIHVKYSKWCLAHIISFHKILALMFDFQRPFQTYSTETSNSSDMVASLLYSCGISNMLRVQPYDSPFLKDLCQIHLLANLLD